MESVNKIHIGVLTTQRLQSSGNGRRVRQTEINEARNDYCTRVQ